ncbi:MAG: dethiobiotin synthase [Actinobacteria bacterium]|nr:dethiobiotin synthase [Actinomycetota bacterium]
MIRFVTGTDTGVGKTLAAAAICRAERVAGRTVLYAKPVQTGLERAEPGDAAFVAAAAKVPVIECLRFPEPLAPAVAAERAGAVIDVDGILADLAKASDGFDRVVVEGAGGLLVPLWAEVTMADLADRLGAGLVVVTRPSLGTLNHTALTLEAAHSRGLPVDGLVISDWPAEPGVTEETNLERLSAMAPVLGLLRSYPGLDTADPATAPEQLAFLTAS